MTVRSNRQAWFDVDLYRVLVVVPTLAAVEKANGWTRDEVDRWSHEIARRTLDDRTDDAGHFWSVVADVVGKHR
jgi:hypothetical protein